MKRQFSAGGIVFKEDQVLVVQNTAIKDKKISFWGFPKGHLEKGETTGEAALREVKEETGIEAKISSIFKKVGESKYFFTQKGERIFKVVTVYLMDYVSGEPISQKGEITESRWMGPEEALRILSFKNDKDLLKKALNLKNGS
jgi:8-oxo-dGTP diphosphatase